MISKKYLLWEFRVLKELACFLFKFLSCESSAANGRGPVMVFPGLGSGNFYTGILVRYLRKKGYVAYGWRAGLNNGDSQAILSKLDDQIERVYARHKQKILLVGWSLGGYYAREMYRLHPDKIRLIITLGSPLKVLSHSSIDSVFKLFAAGNPLDLAMEMNRAAEKLPADAPVVSLYSRTDGIVPAHFCRLDEFRQFEYCEVSSSHMGLPFNPRALEIIEGKLTQTLTP